MSEAILKRKTLAKYKNNSVGSGFSLNGTRRSQGWVGQDTIGRSFPKTLMKGNEIKGHGGCCGSYPKKSIISSSIISLNDPTIIKKSVLETKGMIQTKYRWIWRPQPYSSTKQDTCHTTNSQSEYITNLSVKVSGLIDASYSDIISTKRSFYCCDNINLPREARPKPNINPQIVQTRNPGNYTKTNMSRPERNNPLLGTIGGGYVNYVVPQSTYIAYLDNQCIPKNVSVNCTQSIAKNLLQVALIGGTRTF